MIYDDDPKATYRWEQGINKTWDSVQEDAAGNLITTSNERDRSLRAKQSRITKSIRRGLIRYLVVAIDSSKSAAENDYKPCRLEVSKACVQKFIGEYFDQNPISQLSVIVTRDRSAQRLTELSGNPKNHVHMIKGMQNMDGLASLQNTLLLGMSMLRHIPNYGHRELLIVFSSLSTCDPGDIFNTIKEAKAQKVRISVICLVAEVFICKQMAELTGGMFSVALDATHLSELLQQHTIPPPEIQRTESLVTDFIYMGFPKRTFDAQAAYGFEGKRMKLSSSAYICPRCSTRTTDIPTQCCVCNLQLNSSSHIARSHHHLFPVPNFIEFEVQETVVLEEDADSSNSNALTLKIKKGRVLNDSSNYRQVEKRCYTAICVDTSMNATVSVQKIISANEPVETMKEASNEIEVQMQASSVDISKHGTATQVATTSVLLQQEDRYKRCRGCLESTCVKDKMLLRCPLCLHLFCVECDLFIHDSLHNCPGCG